MNEHWKQAPDTDGYNPTQTMNLTPAEDWADSHPLSDVMTYERRTKLYRQIQADALRAAATEASVRRGHPFINSPDEALKNLMCHLEYEANQLHPLREVSKGGD